MSWFELIIDGGEVEQRVQDTLKAWFPTYLRELELQTNDYEEGQLPAPRAYNVSESLDTFSEDQLPAIAVISPGLADRPTKTGDGKWSAIWEIGVGIVVSARDEATTRNLSRLYSAVIRAIMLQKRSLGGFADGVLWIDEAYDPLRVEEERTFQAGMLTFHVIVGDVVDQQGGPFTQLPPDPDTMPGADWPLAQTVEVTIEGRD